MESCQAAVPLGPLSLPPLKRGESVSTLNLAIISLAQEETASDYVSPLPGSKFLFRGLLPKVKMPQTLAAGGPACKPLTPREASPEAYLSSSFQSHFRG